MWISFRTDEKFQAKCYNLGNSVKNNLLRMLLCKYLQMQLNLT